jgi:uncharacterized protein (DUF433 family)
LKRDPEKLSGAPVFPGTRVPITHLFDYLEGGETIAAFLDDFPTVTQKQVQALLSASRDSLLGSCSDTAARLEIMRDAMKDQLFLADLNETMEGFGHADQEDTDEILTVERLARKP